MNLSHWLPRADEPQTVRLRLVCFAHAGGGAAPFLRWSGLPAGVAVCPVRLPGRESAYAEPPLRRVGAIVDGALQALRSLPPRPTALLGHSFGALIAYEVARALQASDATPELLVVSAKPAPHLRSKLPDLAHLPDTAFITALDRQYGGIPREIRDEPELLAMMLPALRGDMTASEAHFHTPGPRLRCPVIACRGADDRAVDPAGVAAWAELTDGEFTGLRFPGGHFYLYDPASGFQAALHARLAGVLDRAG